ncbi:hypothetical protein [Flavobacterium notoginsengisoli]|uniref:hypothetical protein n=1 Tax=Flavobacterium notoginsengisoli TaxID=1478199 RepID=UPI003630B874
MIKISIDLPDLLSYNKLTRSKENKLKKEVKEITDIGNTDLFLSYQADKNTEINYFFDQIANPADTIVHEKLLGRDTISGVTTYIKQRGSKRVILMTKTKDKNNELKITNEALRRISLDTSNLSKLSYMNLYNFYTIAPHKNFLQGREKIRTAPITDPNKLMFKEALYITLNSFMSNNKEYDLLIKDYEKNKTNFKEVVGNALFSNEVKKDKEVYNTIDKLAKNNQILILNEDHFYPGHRLFAMTLLDILKRNNFKIISFETFVPNTENSPEVIPNSRNGFYIKDPYFGHFVRKASAMGFELLGHENYDRQLDREMGQAKNIMKILENDPQAKIFIYVGHGHLEEEGERRAMASYLKEYSKIDPVTINQETVTADVKHDLVLLPKAVFAQDSLMKSSADYFLINNLHASLESVYTDKVFKTIKLKNSAFESFKNQELLVEVFSMEEYSKTNNESVLIPIQSILMIPKKDEITVSLPLGRYYITVKSVDGALFKFNNFSIE